jgi:Fe-S-cluster containining protein
MIADEPSAPVDRAAGPPPYCGELREIYARLDAEVARLAPVCRISGRCCRFGEYGHTLFLSAPEFEHLLREAPAPARALDDGQTCPWQDQHGRCTAREARPLGCRVFFCDPAYQDAAPGLSEQYLAELRRLADRHRLSWSYAPLHRHLHAAREQGRFPARFGAAEPGGPTAADRGTMPPGPTFLP